MSHDEKYDILDSAIGNIKSLIEDLKALGGHEDMVGALEDMHMELGFDFIACCDYLADRREQTDNEIMQDYYREVL